MNAPQQKENDRMRVIRPTEPVEQPPIPMKLCRGCGTILAESLWKDGVEIHPNCHDAPRLKINQPTEVAGASHPMRTELIDLIRFADRTAVRSQQMRIGPSEIGDGCDRRLGMRIAGVKAVNRTSDPWPAIVGTAMHDWLKRCMDKDNAKLVAAGRPPRWIVEHRVEADQLLVGTSDVYDTVTQTVIDWKSMGDTAKKRLAEHGPSGGYQVQINTYGLGFLRAGFPVQRVALMFLPRAGKLSDARYFEWPFDPAMAQRAIERVYAVGRGVLGLRQQTGVDDVWQQVPADPTALCGWCPFFLRGATAASSRGCPGK